jgi:hypothetical protein
VPYLFRIYFRKSPYNCYTIIRCTGIDVGLCPVSCLCVYFHIGKALVILYQLHRTIKSISPKIWFLSIKIIKFPHCLIITNFSQEYKGLFQLIETKSSSTHPPETTEVLYGNDNIQRRTLEVFSRVKETLDGCNESTEVAMNVKYKAIWNGYAQLKRNGVRLRAITALFFVAFNIGIGSVRTGFIFISLFGVIEVEVATIIAALSFLTGRVLSSTSIEPSVDETISFSPERTDGNPEDETDEIFDAAAIVVDVIGDRVETV